MDGRSSPDIDIGEHHAGPKNLNLDAERALVAATDLRLGLSDAVVRQRLAEWGYNELPEKKVNPWLLFLGYFWGPMPIMIWIAALVELIKASAGYGGWEDFAVLLVLQFANATVGYIEERNAGDAIAALKQQLAPQCHVCRNGKWNNMPARELVPGDLIELKLGDVVPADAMLLLGQQSMEVDQAALTGESLPVTIEPGEKLKMGSAIKRGEAKGVVVATGPNTFFGKAAGMIAGVVHQGRFQLILFRITLGLLALCLSMCAVIFIKLLVTPDTAAEAAATGSKLMRSVSVVVVILVASIPIAIEVVCTSTLAVGSRRLAQKKVIVARLSAIEELAGMTILCSDKTGTLTLNKLSLRDPIIMGKMDVKSIVFYAALASKREVGNQDAIDFCITQAVPVEDRPRLHSFKEVNFVPFNPTDKRTEATIRGPDGAVFRVTKGAPQVILRLCHNKAELKSRVETAVQELADRGFRALGVAISSTGETETPFWEYQGVLSLYDPPRHDTKATIAAAIGNGIEVKMVTGDQTAIAKETCRELGMGTNILNTEVLNDKSISRVNLDAIILQANGFAEVMPEHKFEIVQRLREQGHVTGMTGDGVNDAPALKRADIGIAVHGATDAAKAAADIVLTEPGLSVIIYAIFRSRKIFQRMRNYCIYRISCTIQLLFFFFFAILAINPTSSYFYGDNPMNIPDLAAPSAFTLPVISLVVITILNDGCMITIAHDKVIPEKIPQRWAMTEVTIISLVLGLVACLSSLLMLVGILHANLSNPGGFLGAVLGSSGRDYVRWSEAQTMIYLKISLSDFLTLFSARTRTWFWERRPGYAIGVACIIATMSSTILSLFWDDIVKTDDAQMSGLRASRYACVSVWIYCALWFIAQDFAKVACYAWLANLARNKEHEEQVQRGHVAAMIDTDDRYARMHPGKVPAVPAPQGSRRGAQLVNPIAQARFSATGQQQSARGATNFAPGSRDADANVQDYVPLNRKSSLRVLYDAASSTLSSVRGKSSPAPVVWTSAAAEAPPAQSAPPPSTPVVKPNPLRNEAITRSAASREQHAAEVARLMSVTVSIKTQNEDAVDVAVDAHSPREGALFPPKSLSSVDSVVTSGGANAPATPGRGGWSAGALSNSTPIEAQMSQFQPRVVAHPTVAAYGIPGGAGAALAAAAAVEAAPMHVRE